MLNEDEDGLALVPVPVVLVLVPVLVPVVLVAVKEHDSIISFVFGAIISKKLVSSSYQSRSSDSTT